MHVATPLALLAVVSLLDGVAAAQQPPGRDLPNRERHEGLWIRGAIGFGSVERCGGLCWSRGRHEGGWVHLGAGATISYHLLLGAEVNHIVRGLDDTPSNHTLDFYTAVAHYYPADTNGFFLRGGVGLMRSAFESSSVRGAAWEVGAGYDVGLTPDYSITVHLGYLRTVAGRAYSGSRRYPPNDTSPDVILLGVGFTVH